MRRVVSVVMAGVSGRTGREVTRAILGAKDLRLVGAIGHASAGRDVGEVVGLTPQGLRVGTGWEGIDAGPGTVFVDFTQAGAARLRVPEALRRGMPCVVGTTGLDATDMEAIEAASQAGGVGACVVANFSLGAVLGARLAALALEVFPDVEIVELHGSHKRDRPSGTAAALADALSERRPDGRAVPIHSVRLPGLVAHQEVLFGRPGELLTLRHDVLSREAYSEGVLLCIRKAGALRSVVTRLEEVWEGA